MYHPMTMKLYKLLWDILGISMMSCHQCMLKRAVVVARVGMDMGKVAGAMVEAEPAVVGATVGVVVTVMVVDQILQLVEMKE